MSVIIFPPDSFCPQHSSATTTASTEVPYIVTLNEQHISQKFVPLPNDCNSHLIVTLSLNGIALPQGEFWALIEHVAPEPDIISWQNLKLQTLARKGDTLIISYYSIS